MTASTAVSAIDTTLNTDNTKQVLCGSAVVVPCVQQYVVIPVVRSLQQNVQHHTAVYTSVMLHRIYLLAVLLLLLAQVLLH
jgi:hypothetical protein